METILKSPTSKNSNGGTNKDGDMDIIKIIIWFVLHPQNPLNHLTRATRHPVHKPMRKMFTFN